MKAELIQGADNLVGIAFGVNGSIDEKLSRLQAQADTMRPLVDESLEYDRQHARYGLRAESFLACLPSFQTVAASEPHSLAVAQEVHANFRELSRKVLKQTIDFRHDESYHAVGTGGQLSEIGVLGALWWSIAHGHRDQASYALPATSNEDHGRIKEGYNVGTDIILRVNGSKRQPIQVKTRVSERERVLVNRYYPGIVVIALSDIIYPNRDVNLPIKLLDLVAHDDTDSLSLIDERINEQIDKAKSVSELHASYKKRESQRAYHHAKKKAGRNQSGGRGGNRTLTP